ncbi:MAG: hypothetical protein ABGY95_09265 [Rubritalea sp.]|uniref:hypothetical protein n=1 Tax=Rubritalea sp. TaxID=2109375 RepID=UPI003242417F
MIEWDVRKYPVDESIRVVFKYHQAGTGATELQMVENFAKTKQKGNCEFCITGESYNVNGRVLDWRVEVHAGANLLAAEQSYLWE